MIDDDVKRAGLAEAEDLLVRVATGQDPLTFVNAALAVIGSVALTVDIASQFPNEASRLALLPDRVSAAIGTPQLEDQRDKASKEFTFALARAGLTDSSVRGEKEAELQKTYDLNKQQIADDALSDKGKAQVRRRRSSELDLHAERHR